MRALPWQLDQEPPLRCRSTCSPQNLPEKVLIFALSCLLIFICIMHCIFVHLSKNLLSERRFTKMVLVPDSMVLVPDSYGKRGYAPKAEIILKDILHVVKY